MHRRDQADFLNQVMELHTDYPPHHLLRILHHIEEGAGRRRHEERRYGPRSLDIDILLYGELILHSVDLQIPHPLMHCRPFVLEPLVEVAPDLRDPRTRRLFSSCLKGTPPLY